MTEWDHYGNFIVVPILLEIISDSWRGTYGIQSQRIELNHHWEKARTAASNLIQYALQATTYGLRKKIIRELDLNALHLKYATRNWIEKYTQLPQEEVLI